MAAIRLPAFTLLVYNLVAAAAGDVLVVDASGGGAFTSIQAAISAAVDGDVVLVKSGSYAGFLINQKGLTVVGDAGAAIDIAGGVRVRSIGATQTVVLANLTGTGTPSSGLSSFGVHVFDSQGHVRIEGCTFTGADSVDFDSEREWDAWEGGWVELSERVSITRSNLIGGRGHAGWDPDQGASGSGLHVQGSKVAVYDSVLRGGKGQDNVYGQPDAAHGGDGLHVIDSEVQLSGATARGGKGGEGTPVYFVLYALGGNGGDGVDASGATQVRILDTDLVQGLGGKGHPDSGANGKPGLTRRGDPGLFTDYPGMARHLTFSSPVREGTTSTLLFEGKPGDRVSLLVATEPAFTLRPAWKGTLLVQPRSPFLMRYEGVVPASGSLSTSFELGELGAGVEELEFYLQSLHKSPGGGTFLGTGQVLTALDSAY